VDKLDEELTPEQKFAAEDAETMVPRALMQGRNPDDIVRDLMRFDWTPAAARAMVSRVMDDLQRFHASPEVKADLVREARQQFFLGAFLIVVSLCISGLTLLAPLAGGVDFVILAVGVLLVGLVIGGRGLARWRLYRREGLPSEWQER
jgi:hypothetical protein